MDESPIVKPTFDNDEESDTCESDPDPNPNYTVLNDVKEFINHLEMMHDRRIVKNLQSAGLSNFGFDEDDEESYCNLDPKAKMVTGEPLMLACVLYIKDGEQQVRRKPLINNNFNFITDKCDNDFSCDIWLY